MRLGECLSRSGRCGGEKLLSRLPRIEPLPLSCPAFSLVSLCSVEIGLLHQRWTGPVSCDEQSPFTWKCVKPCGIRTDIFIWKFFQNVLKIFTLLYLQIADAVFIHTSYQIRSSLYDVPYRPQSPFFLYPWEWRNYSTVPINHAGRYSVT
jgi:hypothetical protein